VLVADNAVFANGSSCIKVLQASHVWAVDNTCFKNGLDRRQGGPGELTVVGADSVDVHLIDNVAYASAGRDAFVQRGGAVVDGAGNVAFGGVPEDGVVGVVRADPRFTRPPYVDDARDQQQRVALAPWYARRGLAPRPDSPLVDAGIDPLLARGVTPALRTGLRRYLREDVAGHPRPEGARWDVGAYEVR
jgi:hypothetical protein